jgi:hypothetical protein
MDLKKIFHRLLALGERWDMGSLPVEWTGMGLIQIEGSSRFWELRVKCPDSDEQMTAYSHSTPRRWWHFCG